MHPVRPSVRRVAVRHSLLIPTRLQQMLRPRDMYKIKEFACTRTCRAVTVMSRNHGISVLINSPRNSLMNGRFIDCFLGASYHKFTYFFEPEGGSQVVPGWGWGGRVLRHISRDDETEDLFPLQRKKKRESEGVGGVHESHRPSD